MESAQLIDCSRRAVIGSNLRCSASSIKPSGMWRHLRVSIPLHHLWVQIFFNDDRSID